MFNNKAITLVFRVKDFSSTRTDLLEQALKTNILTLSQASAPTSSSSNFNIEYVIAPGINLFTTQDGANYISILIGYTYAMDDRVIERAVIEDTRVEGELVTRVVTLLREQAQATLVLSGTCRGHSYIVSKRMDYLEQRSIPNAARLAGADRISNDEYTWAVAPGANLSAIGEFARAYLQKLTFPSMPRPAEAITQLPLTKPSRSYPGMPSLSAPMTPEIKRLFGFVVFMLIAAGIPMIPSIATSFMALSGVATVMSYTSYLFVSYLPWSAIVVTMDTNTAT
nr:hypothetical protein [Candidatus Sigynarchaeota archaeon]